MYLFYLGGILLPIAPAKLNIKGKNQNKTISLINEGEITLLKNMGLKEISFTIMIPGKKYPFAKYLGGFLPIQFYVSAFEKMKNLKKPVQFIVIRNNTKLSSVYNTNITVSLEDFQIIEDAEVLGDDINISLTLKEYKSKNEIVFKTLATGAGITQYTLDKVRDFSAKEIPKNYTIKSGDTLYSIAKKQLGNGEKWRELIELNNLENNVDLQVGQVIRLE